MNIKWTKKPNADNIMNRIFNDNTMVEINNILIKEMDPFVPCDTGYLANSAVATKDGIEYRSDYAKYIYHNENIELDTTKHPLASVFWDEKMLLSRSNELYKQIQELIDKG